jgi:orotidine-5'-phosphate decarboxylase
MSRESFCQKLVETSRMNDSLLCVGLDPDYSRIPDFLKSGKTEVESIAEFIEEIIECTTDLVCSYKPNLAFYEVLGSKGIKLLENVISMVPDHIPVILDAKHGDIGNTAKQYAKAVFDTLEADAVTINPFLGRDSIEPFLVYPGKCAFVLCRTSNPSAVDIQDLEVETEHGKKPLYHLVAEKILEWKVEWKGEGEIGAIAGATYPRELSIIRRIIGDNIPILIPGIGAQHGMMAEAVSCGTNTRGELAIFNSSRDVLFASSSRKYKEAARDAAMDLKNGINHARKTKRF